MKLRLSTSRADQVNAILAKILPSLKERCLSELSQWSRTVVSVNVTYTYHDEEISAFRRTRDDALDAGADTDKCQIDKIGERRLRAVPGSPVVGGGTSIPGARGTFSR